MSKINSVILTGCILDFFLQSELIQTLWIDSDSNAVTRNNAGRVKSIQLYESDFPGRNDVFTFIEFLAQYNLFYENGKYVFDAPFIPGKFQSKPRVSAENLKQIGTAAMLNIPEPESEPSHKIPRYSPDELFEILDYLQFPKTFITSEGELVSLKDYLRTFLMKHRLLEYLPQYPSYSRPARYTRRRHEIYTPWNNDETGWHYIPKKHLPQSRPPPMPRLENGVWNNPRLAGENVKKALERSGLALKPAYKQKSRRKMTRKHRA